MRSQPSNRLSATAFDVVTAALSPALIIGMIASLIFFLVIAFYEGQYDVRLIVLLGLFTVAIVLIARIAIESGRMHANAFAVPLAIAAALAMMRFVTVSGPLAPIGWLINIGLLALAWYLADRITFDCTLLEEDREGVQGGLLQTLGAAQRVAQEARESGKGATEALKRAKHNPGVWVLYFALLAFPLFGLGQLAISDPAQRSVAFWLLASYLGCALALLMTTSLLAMRRYLRQRKVWMSSDITARWLASGTGLILAVLLLCMLLPLPGRSLGLIGWPVEIGSPEGLATSRFGMGNDGQVRPNGVPKANAPGEPGDAVAKGGQPRAARGPAQKKEGGKKPDQGDNQADSAPAQDGKTSANDSSSADSKSGRSQSSDGKSSDAPSNNSQSNKTKSSDGDSSDGKSNPSRDDAAGQDERRADSSKSEDQPRADRQPSEASDAGEKTGEKTGDNAGDNAGADDNAAANAQEARGAGEKSAEPKAASDPPASTPPGSSIASTLEQFLAAIGPWFKWLTIAVLAVIVLVYVVTHLGELGRMWRDFLNFFALLFGRKRLAVPSEAVAKSKVEDRTVSRPRFSSFENPFARNLQGWRGEHVVEHTFAALEAWASEYGRVRRVDQTAEEFAKSLTAELPQLLKLPVVAATMLDRVMFASWRPVRDDLGPLSELWHILQSTSPLERVEKASDRPRVS